MGNCNSHYTQHPKVESLKKRMSLGDRNAQLGESGLNMDLDPTHLHTVNGRVMIDYINVMFFSRLSKY